MNTILQNKWMIIASIEFLVILSLLVKLRKGKKTESLDKEILKSKDSRINMSDLMNNINLAPSLYKKLSRACHPDRFAGTELEITANELFQEVQQSENDYVALCDLKKQVEEKLNLSIS
jgi:hypothetical protein